MSFRLSMLCLAAILAVNSVNAKVADEGKQATFSDIQVVSNIAEYIKSHPNVTLTPMSMESDPKTAIVYYTKGNRVPGDHLAGQKSDSIVFQTLTNYELTLIYPGPSILTYVHIACTSDSDSDRAYIVSGGIGQRSISIIIEAYHTRRFEYAADFYGLN